MQDVLTFTGLKCDNPLCDFKDETIPFKEYPNYLNKNCPKCGEILLTKADYRTCKRLVMLSRPLRVFNSFSKNTKMVRFKTNMNGTGRFGFEKSQE